MNSKRGKQNMATVIRRTERSWAISMISDINIKLQSLNIKIARAGGETTISTGHESMFPDVLLYGDENQTQILQGWELKLPDTAITNYAFINDAQRKAISLGLNSFFIWNFSAGALYVRGENGEFNIAKQWNDTSYIQTRDDVEKYRTEWLSEIEKILLEINEYLVTGTIRGSVIGEVISDTIVSTIIERNKMLVSEELRGISATNTIVGAYISVWWDGVQSEFVSDETNMFNAYAKVVLLNWANRIIFAHLIKYSHNAAMEVNNLSFDTEIIVANAVFEEITKNCDFYNIFGGLEHNYILPEDTWHDLMDLNIFLTSNGVYQIEQTALQNILEHTVAVSQREVNGQFTTPDILANILVSLSTLDWTGEAIDPCCGTGSISKAILKNKKKQLNNVQLAVDTTWASDKFSFPLQIANISMTDIDTINMPSRIFKRNALLLNEGDSVQVTSPVNGELLNFDIPKFKTIVSNLPFVQFEKIPDMDLKYIDNIYNQVQEATGITLSNRNDYYTSIVFALHRIHDIDGRMGIITSNSWLGTTSGRDFFNALSRYYKIEQVHISNSSRWFDNAKVVTVITILTKRMPIGVALQDEQTSFCSWQKSLAELRKSESNVDMIVNSALLNRELDPRIMKLKTYTYSEIMMLCAMNISLSALFHNVSWLLNIRDKLVPIYEVFEVVRGERRGWDTMFYPAAGHGIEECYIRKVLKSSRSVNSLFAEVDNDAFCCSKSLEELRELNHLGALKWIERFENGVNNKGRPLPEVLARHGLYWYEMKDTSVANIVTTMNPDQRLFFAKFETPSFINQRLIGMKTTTNYQDVNLYHALLNSLIGMFYTEAVGFGRGLGALDFNSNTMRNAYMLNPSLIDNNQRKRILEKFSALLKRNVYPTVRELSEADRIEFDYEVLRAYQIEHYYDDIKSSLLSMQKMRLSVR